MPELLTWPYPPNFVGEQPQAAGLAESCVVTLERGVEITGRLEALVPENRRCRVMLQGEAAPSDIAWDGLRALRLRSPLAVRHLQAVRDATVVAPAQNCVVTFKDGGKLSGESLGFIAVDGGLFIFMPLGPDTVERYFFPQHAIRRYQVGEHLGEILIEHKAASRRDVEAGLKQQQTLKAQLTGDYLVEDKVIGRDQLMAALKHQQTKSMLKVGEALLELNLITETQLQEALGRQVGNRKLPLGHILVEMGFIDKDGLKRALSQKLGIPFVDLSSITVAPSAANLVEEEYARSNRLLPLCIEDGALIVVMDDPFNPETCSLLSIKVRMRVVPVTAQSEAIVDAIKRYYDKSVNTAWY